MNILIPNIGRRGYLVRYIKNISEFNGKVYVSDCDYSASGLYGPNDGHFILPKPVDDEEKYVDYLIDLCMKVHITLIIPVIDPEIFILSKYIERFAKEHIFLLVSSKEVLNICYNKITMNNFLLDNGFLVPQTYDNIAEFESDYVDRKIDFPVIVKPIYGSGSVSTYKIDSMEEMKAVFHSGLEIQQFINGQEYGVDVFNNLEKEPVRCVVKEKIAMRSGETDKAQTVKNKEIQNTLIRLAKKLGHIGNLDCDVLKSGKKIYVIDLNPRFGGGYPATHESGVNLLKLVIAMTSGETIKPDFEHYMDNLLVMKEVGIVTKRVK